MSIGARKPGNLWKVLNSEGLCLGLSGGFICKKGFAVGFVSIGVLDENIS